MSPRCVFCLRMMVLSSIAVVLLVPHRFIAAQEQRDSAEVQRTVEDVLSDSDYRHLNRASKVESNDDESELPHWLKSFLEWLFGKGRDRIENSSVKFDLSAIAFYGCLAFLVVVLILILAAVLKSGRAEDLSLLNDSGDDEAINPSKPAGELPVNEYERRALLAADTGDFRRAIRELVLGAMSWTERRGLIRYRRGLTNRDYIRANWRDEGRRTSLLQIVGAFELVFYGHRTADKEMFENSLAEFRTSFSSEVNDVQPTS